MMSPTKVTGPIRALALAVLGLSLAACGTQGLAEPSEAPQVPDESEDEMDQDGSMPLGGVSEETLAQLIAAAADELGFDASAVSVVSAESVTWSDGSIGCPEPGMMYTQALVPGYRVVLEVDGEELHFHAAEGRAFFLCDNPQPPSGNS